MSEGAVFDIEPTASISESLRPIGVALQMLLKSGPQRVTIETIRPHRSLSANALYWTWLDALAKHFSKGGNKFDKDAMHDLMRHKFLGYEDKTVGKTVISQQLKSTADLTPSGASTCSKSTHGRRTAVASCHVPKIMNTPNGRRRLNGRNKNLSRRCLVFQMRPGAFRVVL